MNREILAEMTFFLISVLAGASLIIAYDILRTFRRFIKHNTFWLSLEDLFFWTAAGVFLFLVMERYYDGIVRGFSLLGALLGMLVCQEFLSEPLIWIAETIIRFWLRIIRSILNVILWPVHLIGKGMEALGNFVRKILKKCIKILKNTLKNSYKGDKIDNRTTLPQDEEKQGETGRSKSGKAKVEKAREGRKKQRQKRGICCGRGE